MARFVLIGFIVLPFAEIALLIKAGQAFGLFPTLALVVGAVLLGLWLIRAQGFALGGQLRGALARRQWPARTLADAMFVFVAGVLLIVPGFLTDALALLLLLRPLRDAAYRVLSARWPSSQPMPPPAPSGEPWRPGPPRAIDLDADEFRPR